MTDHSALPPGFKARTIDTLRFIRDPEGALAKTYERLGDPFAVDVGALGIVIHTRDPECVRTIFMAPPDAIAPFRPELMAPFLGTHSLLLEGGERHKADRKLLMPAFHGERMRLYGRTIRDVALRHGEGLRQGGRFAMADVTQSISLEVILRTIFGMDRSARGEEIHRAVVDYVAAFHPLILFFPALRRSIAGLGPWARYLRTYARLDALLKEEIDRRREDPTGDDILALLLAARYDDGAAMTREEIRDQLLTMLFAGHETTATVLAWAFYHLSTDEAARQRLLAELATLGPEPAAEEVARLPYLDAVCNETLRLHPVAPNIMRTLRRPLTLKGYELPAGISVMVDIISVHTRKDLYPEPAVWRPERFLSRSYSPFEFLAFGGGSRRCIGAAFASYEMKIVLAALLPRYQMTSTARRPLRTVRRNLTLGPERGVPMVIAPAPKKVVQQPQ